MVAENKTKREKGENKINKTRIEWVKNPDGSQGYTWNPITGCLNHVNGLCKGGGFPCYAYKLANGRLKSRYLANKNTSTQNYDEDSYPFYPRFWEERLGAIPEIPDFKEYSSECRRQLQVDRQRGIFVCDMSDLFGIGIPDEWTSKVMEQIKLHPEHRFYLLTKQPQNLIKFSPFPDNAWVGVTATRTIQYAVAAYWLKEIEAKVKFISLEPFLERIAPKAWPWQLFPEGNPKGICDWLIIGACTGTKRDMEELCKRYLNLTLMHWKGNIWTAQPRIVDLREIVEAADRARIPVFLKDNLDSLLRTVDGQIPTGLCDNYGHTLRQEMPGD